jgi:hypothetical protein
MSSLKTIIIEKNCNMKELLIKIFNIDDLYKKCNFKKNDDFEERCTWNVKLDSNKYYIKLFAKNKGKSGYENKYDFPPPIDKELYFGSCILFCYTLEKNNKNYQHLTIELWNKIYEKLFGGFEDLNNTADEDENEEDELENIPKEKKTKNGYLKDGFVVDSEDTSDDEDDDDDENTDDENIFNPIKDIDDDDSKSDMIDIGSELTEDMYED